MSILLANPATDAMGFAPKLLRWLNLPGLTEFARGPACTQMQHLAAQRQRLRQAALAIPPVDEDAAMAPIRDALESGSELPDLVSTAAGAARYANEHDQAGRFLRALDDELGARLESEAHHVAADVLPFLHQQVVTAVTEARPRYPKLKGASSLEHARDGGVTRDWDLVANARERYAQARVAQRMVTPNAFGEVDPKWDRVAHLANPEQVWGEDFLYWFRGVGAVEEKGSGRTRGIRPPWPDQSQHHAYFDWLLRTPKAEPWVPTWDQIEDRIGTVNAASRALVHAQLPTTPNTHQRYMIDG